MKAIAIYEFVEKIQGLAFSSNKFETGNFSETSCPVVDYGVKESFLMETG